MSDCANKVSQSVSQKRFVHV